MRRARRALRPRRCVTLSREPSERARDLLWAGMHDHQETCLQSCNDCAAVCDHCANACMNEPEPQKYRTCMQTTLDCAAICRLVAELIARDSRFSREAYLLCAQVCEATAAECERHAADHCQVCAETCRACADECRRMAG